MTTDRVTKCEQCTLKFGFVLVGVGYRRERRSLRWSTNDVHFCLLSSIHCVSFMVMDGLSHTIAPGLNSPGYSHHPDSAISSWAFPSILRHGRAGGESLSNVSQDQLQKCLEPVVVRLQQLDAEALLQLTRVESGGARLRNG